ncbi:NAD-dependent protein deacetylase sirtuin-7 [Parasteatoda tepidariorum]|uniref:NAD-dependent protein deacetylase sirtuin-7 n=1 Tax=Parasteatoda tepidariorum TaxID=114398 RepID=UPI00077FA95E|nr:NAD-dependent protein deacetylase sirtuin-7 [Parasteatoda tepidariorum]
MSERSRRQIKKSQDLLRIIHIEKERSHLRLVRKIMKKPLSSRTNEEIKLLEEAPDLVQRIQNNKEKHVNLKERIKEVIDDPEVLSAKCLQLAQALKESAYTVVYTGAGISTSAEIPDYRGPDGVWTLLQKGQEIKLKDLSQSEPTFTHMALKQLHKEGLLSHIVSQNCDGLHLRSGLPRNVLSELHGNMFIEVCPNCKPLKQYIRLFDVTERTALHRHKTGRFCNKCKSELVDTIVHFGEKGKLQWPMNWKGAVKAVDKAEVILCLGSSLKVLRRYPQLWRNNQSLDKRPKLYIVNLQWTPKDSQAVLKINGKCDEVMQLVLSSLNINAPKYKKQEDPIFNLATPLLPHEYSSCSRLHLIREEENCSKQNSVLNTVKKEETDKEKALICMNHNLVPCIKLQDVTSASTLLQLNAQKIDSRTYFIKNFDKNNISGGWYGKGCAKLKKRKPSLSCKRRKIVDSSPAS